jgi:cyclopropane-fatty-acyl-phospholipid synthase
VTLSREQKDLADKRIAASVLTKNIEVWLCDHRAPLTPREGYYDKVASIEMLEAVGQEFLTTCFACVDKLLRPEGGITVF